MGSKDTVRYNHKHLGHVTDRGFAQYHEMLFSDEYIEEEHSERLDRLEEKYGEDWSWRYLQEPAIKRSDQSIMMYGGEAEAFSPGKVILDLGSGEAIADIQLSQQHPDVCIVGVDTGYDQIRKPDLEKPGLQLVSDDWNTLATIPDNSVDTILSVQGAFTWGFRSNDEAIPLVQAVTRVAKEGAVLRFDLDILQATSDATEKGVFAILSDYSWEYSTVEGAVIAKLIGKVTVDN